MHFVGRDETRSTLTILRVPLIDFPVGLHLSLADFLERRKQVEPE